MGGLGAPELLIILVVVLLLFGGSKLPQLARSLGQAKREFEAGTREDNSNSTSTTTVADDAPKTKKD